MKNIFNPRIQEFMLDTVGLLAYIFLLMRVYPYFVFF